MSSRTDSSFPPPRFERAFVLGLGLSGAAASRLLRRKGVEVVASDRRDASLLGVDDLANDPGVELRANDREPTLPAGVDAVIASPGVPMDHPLLAAARAARIPIAAEVELAFQHLVGTVVGITGSNGKSTTTAMTGALLAGAGMPVEVCGNIGRPLSAVVEGPPGRTFVVELSSFQLETIHRFRAHAATLLNISPDHLDRHGDLTGYLAAKRRIFENQGADDVAVLNADEPEVAASATKGTRRYFSFVGRNTEGCRREGDEIVEIANGAVSGRALFRLGDVPLPGPHNVENAMAAALLARAVGVSGETIAPSLRSFRGLPHRVELVGEFGGVAFYNDSKGTNVAATARSLEGFADRSVHLILGGRNKGADFAYLAGIVGRKARAIYLIGESSALIEKALGATVRAARAETLDVAVAQAAAEAGPGEVVLLSPACASFDQFRDYVDRGESFARLVRALDTSGARAGRA